MSIDPAKYGEFIGETKTAIKNIEESIKGIHKRVDEHMNTEDEENEEFNARLGKIDARLGAMEKRFDFALWMIKWLAPAIGLLWPLLIPFLQQYLINMLRLNPDSLLTFLPLWGTIL